MGEEFAILQEAEFESAHEATNGNMSLDSRVSSWSVFTKPNVFSAFATTELRDYVLQFGRTTRNVFEQQWLDNYLGDN